MKNIKSYQSLQINTFTHIFFSASFDGVDIIEYYFINSFVFLLTNISQIKPSMSAHNTFWLRIIYLRP